MASLLENERRRNPGLSDEAHVVAIAADLCREYALEPPVPLKVVAGLCGINTIEQVPGLDVPGCLVKEDDEWVIKLRAEDSNGRQNFTGFHEAGHTFHPGYELKSHQRCHPLTSTDSASIEALCDVAALEFLLPHRHFIGSLKTASFDLDSVDQLASVYGASREATARRLATLWPEPAFVLRLEICNKLNEPPDAPPRIRATTGLRKSAHWDAIFRLKSVDVTDPLCALMTDDEFVGSSKLGGLQPDSGRYFDVHARKSTWMNHTTGEIRNSILLMARLKNVTR